MSRWWSCWSLAEVGGEERERERERGRGCGVRLAGCSCVMGSAFEARNECGRARVERRGAMCGVVRMNVRGREAAQGENV